ncbi:hypothetical protein RB3611 [Rhodopirellula baltica SH 1]|uniref:Uncharacterized protein n=1 Tax=Rhodopirellula baltica (strain DSM 10527 / NCIMB 13988 / SH1) TaxID=243090 RepID=Q7UTZ0_RHOBA|nr:hypothetical protein RB3611 [Rhodopirellula baltica SH 1]
MMSRSLPGLRLDAKVVSPSLIGQPERRPIMSGHDVAIRPVFTRLKLNSTC